MIAYADPFGNTYVQPVVYEWRPPRCTNCLNFGQLKEKCIEPCLEVFIDQMKQHEKHQSLVDLGRLQAEGNEENDEVGIVAKSSTSDGVMVKTEIISEIEIEPGEIVEHVQVQVNGGGPVSKCPNPKITAICSAIQGDKPTPSTSTGVVPETQYLDNPDINSEPTFSDNMTIGEAFTKSKSTQKKER